MMNSGAPDRLHRLEPFLTGLHPTASYGEVAADLDMSVSAVKVAVHRMRRRFGQLLRQEVAQTVDDPSEIDGEIRYLFSVIDS
jgi:RNA polymerase sigma-70 factor (ECF subfamily)